MEAQDHILIVDDDAEIRSLLGDYLRKNSYRTTVAADGKATGPFTRSELAAMVADGTLGRDDYLWTPGGPDWVRGRDVTELADLFSAPPPPPAG